LPWPTLAFGLEYDYYPEMLRAATPRFPLDLETIPDDTDFTKPIKRGFISNAYSYCRVIAAKYKALSTETIKFALDSPRVILYNGVLFELNDHFPDIQGAMLYLYKHHLIVDGDHKYMAAEIM
jgi:hypothetical protein